MAAVQDFYSKYFLNLSLKTQAPAKKGLKHFPEYSTMNLSMCLHTGIADSQSV